MHVPAAGKMETREVILQHYLQLVRENLHVVLAMSPIGAGFRTRCRMFPSLVNCCTIDWFDAWPEDALYSVAHRLLNERPDLGIGAHIAPLCKVAGTSTLTCQWHDHAP
jgi:dynein heavy chain